MEGGVVGVIEGGVVGGGGRGELCCCILMRWRPETTADDMGQLVVIGDV